MADSALQLTLHAAAPRGAPASHAPRGMTPQREFQWQARMADRAFQRLRIGVIRTRAQGEADAKG